MEAPVLPTLSALVQLVLQSASYSGIGDFCPVLVGLADRDRTSRNLLYVAHCGCIRRKNIDEGEVES
jgi:hypothetical protein